MKKVTSILTNKYLLAGLFFIVWMLFFDQRNYFQQKETMGELDKLETKKRYYEEQIEKAKAELQVPTVGDQWRRPPTPQRNPFL